MISRNPSAGKALRSSVVLVGLMGAGKSTIGRRLAETLNAPFTDADNEIAIAAGCSISDIFAIYGEPIFRDLEQRVMLRLLTGPPVVIATGGGAFMNPAIRQAVHEKAVSVWLKADLEVLLERVSRKNTRPLLETGDKRAILMRLMEERHPVYGEAEIVVDSGHGKHENVVSGILQALEERGFLG